MNTTRTSLLSLSAIAALMLASCASLEPGTQVRDDVYFRPSDAPPTATNTSKPRPSNPEQMDVVDDYFDPGTSRDLGTSRSFYDIAYNDPFYYNTGRFGFGMGPGMGMGMGMGMMGWQTGWNGPGWGMSMGYGWGGGSMGWGSPYGWYDPWDPWNRWDPWNPWNAGMGWNRPWGWNQPWGWNRPGMMGWGMGGGMGGWGMGNYWGPWGNCFNCYMPVIIGGSSNTFVGHRPTFGGAGGGTGGTLVTTPSRLPLRDPVGLAPDRREAQRVRPEPSMQQRQELHAPGRQPGVSTPRSVPQRIQAQPAPGRTSPERTRTMPERSVEPRTAPRSFDQPQRMRDGGSFQRSPSAPSFSPGGGGGGIRTPGAPRPR